MARAILIYVAALTFLVWISIAQADPTTGTLGFSFAKQYLDEQKVPRLSRRQSKTISGTLTNDVVLYLINITVGAPPQPISLIIDTGSTDIWFPDINLEDCQIDQSLCPYGTYNGNRSTTYVDPHLPGFEIQYADGTDVAGEYLIDSLKIGSTTVTNVTMARVLENYQFESAGSPIMGVMGVSLRQSETDAFTGGFTYPTLNEILVTEGLTNAAGFSLWLDDANAQTGQILFGGVDSAKYHGDLIALPIQPDSQTDAISSFTVAWTGLNITGSKQIYQLSPSFPQAAVLDSGSTDTYLPDDIVQQILNGVGVTTDDLYGNTIPCDAANDDLTFSFAFGGEGGPIINVDLSSFITPLLTTDESLPHYPGGKRPCSFAIDAVDGTPIVFGDSFLRNAYVVYDISGLQIGMANTNFDSTSQNIKPFGKGSGIPGAVTTVTGVSVTQTFSDDIEPTFVSDISSMDTDMTTFRTPTFVFGSTTSSSSSGQTTATANNAGSSIPTTSTAGGSRSSGASSSTSTNSNQATSILQTSPLKTEVFIIGTAILASLLLGGGLILL